MAAKTKKKTTKKKTAKKRLPRLPAFEYDEDENPATVYLSRQRGHTERTQRSALEQVADMLTNGRIGLEQLPWHQIRTKHINALIGRFEDHGYAPASANKYLSALRAVLKQARRQRLLDQETLADLLDIKGISGKTEPRGRALRAEELERLFKACYADENTAAGMRDLAILALLYGCGLRRSELAALELKDYNAREKYLLIHGKGRKQRRAYIPEGAFKALYLWFEERTRTKGPLFCHVSKIGTVSIQGISDNLVYRVTEKRRQLAGIRSFTPHDLRRSYISDLLDKNVDIAIIARQVGHSSIQTTARYDRRGERAQKRAAEQLDVPI